MQEHLDRLTSTDASFLHQEGDASHMHIGGVLIFDGPAPDFDAFADHIRSRLHLVPRYRHKLVTPALQTGQPLWIDDPDFNLSYHVRHTALPEPGARSSCGCSWRGSHPSGWIDPSRCGSTGSSRASRVTASRSSQRPITRSSTGSPASTSRRSSSISSARRRPRPKISSDGWRTPSPRRPSCCSRAPAGWCGRRPR